MISPPAAFLGAPWALLPSLHDRAFALTPSATAWVRAREAVPSSSRAVFVAGPGLATGGGEVVAVAALRPGATLLVGLIIDRLRRARRVGRRRARAHRGARVVPHREPDVLVAGAGRRTADRRRHPPPRPPAPSDRAAGLPIRRRRRHRRPGRHRLRLRAADPGHGRRHRVDRRRGRRRDRAGDAGAACRGWRPGSGSTRPWPGARRAASDDPVRHATAVLFAAMGAA